MLCCSTCHTVTHTLTKTCSNTPFCREGQRRGPNPARKRNSKYMKNGTEVELLWAKPPRQDTQPALLAHQLQPRPLTAHLNRDGTPKWRLGAGRPPTVVSDKIGPGENLTVCVPVNESHRVYRIPLPLPDGREREREEAWEGEEGEGETDEWTVAEEISVIRSPRLVRRR